LTEYTSLQQCHYQPAAGALTYANVNRSKSNELFSLFSKLANFM